MSHNAETVTVSVRTKLPRSPRPRSPQPIRPNWIRWLAPITREYDRAVAAVTPRKARRGTAFSDMTRLYTVASSDRVAALALRPGPPQALGRFIWSYERNGSLRWRAGS